MTFQNRIAANSRYSHAGVFHFFIGFVEPADELRRERLGNVVAFREFDLSPDKFQRRLI